MKNRLHRIDELRGFTLISMILYHFMWDLKYLAGFNMNWYTGPFGYVWQKSICICFILISGFCFSMGKNRLKRGLIVFFAGVIITIVTLTVMPENRVVFGVLTFLGSASLIMIPIDKLNNIVENKCNKKTFNISMFILTFLLFVSFYNVNNKVLYFPLERALPNYLYKGYLATYIGFPDNAFFSTDYFALLPWIFIYMTGYYLNKVYKLSNHYEKINSFLSVNRFECISFFGRHSLLIYMVHQPVLYLITLAVQKLI